MNRRNFVIGIFVFVCLLLIGANALRAQEEGSALKVKGSVEEISPAGDYMVVAGRKIILPGGFLDNYYLEKGDVIEVTVKETDSGLEAEDFEYVFESEGESIPAEDSPSIEEPASPSEMY